MGSITCTFKAVIGARGVAHYSAPISHPSSVGLIERTIQLTISSLRAKCSELHSPRPIQNNRGALRQISRVSEVSG